MKSVVCRVDPVAAAKRNVPLEMFASLAQIPGVRLFSLQKGAISAAEQAIAQQLGLIEFGEDLDSSAGPFIDTAAIMRNLDLVVTSDTSIAHLAGALGVPVWTALPFAPDWRWLMDRADTPWYPAMRLFRQSKRGEGDVPFQRMAADLRNMLPTTRE